MHKLYVQIYATVVGVMLIVALSSSAMWWYGARALEHERFVTELGAFAEAILPPAGGDPAALEARLDELVGRLPVDVTLYSANGIALANHGPAVPAPRDPPPGRWARAREHRHVVGLALPDGRRIAVRLPGPREGWAYRPLAAVLVLALATALGAYPMVRRLTRRLEALRAQVVALGEGALDARVEVSGRDEVAELATSFNRTAERIERLVEDKKRALAMTSHELRTPLARLRVALELVASGKRPDLRADIERDIAELDGLIGDLLAASRLDSPAFALVREPVDLLALLAEEAAPHGLEVEGESAPYAGDSRLLARMIRNLLENARRYAGDADFARVQRASSGGWSIEVADRGPGVPEPERERIFEPFYRSRDGASEEGGLGLSLVRQIAERHGGTATCGERPGGGAVFRVVLPD